MVGISGLWGDNLLYRIQCLGCRNWFFFDRIFWDNGDIVKHLLLFITPAGNMHLYGHKCIVLCLRYLNFIVPTRQIFYLYHSGLIYADLLRLCFFSYKCNIFTCHVLRQVYFYRTCFTRKCIQRTYANDKPKQNRY